MDELNAVQKPKISKISLDNSIESVVELDKSGEKLFFESDQGKFLELPEDIVRGLSAKNKESYLFALLAHKKESVAPQPSPGLRIQPEFAKASDRLDFEYTPEFRAKFHPCLKRPDELRRALAEGYTYVTSSDGVKGFLSPDARGNIFVGVAGYPEMYLMKIPVEIYEKRLKEVENRSQAFNKAVDEQTIETLGKLGGKPFEAHERDDKNWKTLD
jgi:hypothetical protein